MELNYYKVIDPKFWDVNKESDWKPVRASSIERAAEIFCQMWDEENGNEYLDDKGGRILVATHCGGWTWVEVTACQQPVYSGKLL